MWTEADRAGRLKDRPGTLKARLMPFDSVNVEKALQDLADGRFIIRYQVDGERYIQIRTWNEHQRPHHTERESVFPSSVNGELTVISPLENGEKKDSRNREHSLPFPSLPFPSSLEGDDAFKTAWDDWVGYRKEIKKPLTKRSMQAQLDEFARWGSERAIAAIRHTIRMTWQGLREPEEAGNSRGPRASGLSSHEAAIKRLEDMGLIGRDDDDEK
jgi:hypothetical protein